MESHTFQVMQVQLSSLFTHASFAHVLLASMVCNHKLKSQCNM